MVPDLWHCCQLWTCLFLAQLNIFIHQTDPNDITDVFIDRPDWALVAGYSAVGTPSIGWCQWRSRATSLLDTGWPMTLFQNIVLEHVRLKQFGLYNYEAEQLSGLHPADAAGNGRIQQCSTDDKADYYRAAFHILLNKKHPKGAVHLARKPMLL